jgi:hypothetical protein
MWTFLKTSSSDFSSIWVFFFGCNNCASLLGPDQITGRCCWAVAVKGVCASLFAFEFPFKTFYRSFATNAEQQASGAIL